MGKKMQKFDLQSTLLVSTWVNVKGYSLSLLEK